MDDRLIAKVQSLSDIELAVLVCLITDQHCIIEAGQAHLNAVLDELKLVAANVFGLNWAVLDCNEHTTLDDFGSGILVNEDGDDYVSDANQRTKLPLFPGSSHSARKTSKSPRPLTPLEGRCIANVVIAKNLNQVTSQVQIQALELMRGKRNFTRTAVHAAPKPFLLIALDIKDSPRLTLHLNDHFFISHTYQDGDELLNSQGQEDDDVMSSDSSSRSIVHRPAGTDAKQASLAVRVAREDLLMLSSLKSKVKISSEVRAYLHNVVVFLRLHRAVAGGVSAISTRHLDTLAHTLAPLHGLGYVTPSLVALAARKVYPHRITITAPGNERSMQWGSSLEAVKAVLAGVTVQDIVQEVLESVEAPL